MDNKKIIIGVGVVALLGVGYYMMKKNKQTPLVNMPNKPALPTFDRDKASKEWAILLFKTESDRRERNKKEGLPVMQAQRLIIDPKTGQQTVEDVKNTIKSELNLYYEMLKTLNYITDDSDAEFMFNQYKTMLQSGDDRNYKPDLNTQIRMDSIQKKYPKAGLS